MNKRTIIINLLLVLLAAPHAVVAQVVSGSAHDWAAVISHRPGDHLVVKLKSGQTMEGRLKNASETGLALGNSGKTVDVRREDVRQIYHITGATSKKPALIGAVIGAAGGAGLGATAGNCKNAQVICFDRSRTIPALAAVGAGIGAVIGLAVGKGRHKQKLIYEAS